MDPASRLFGLCFAMLVGCYVFGSIPLTLSFTEKNLRSLSIIGAGLIVGTALSVIIPEGVHTLYEQQLSLGGGAHGHSGHHHQTRSLNQLLDAKPAEVVGEASILSSDQHWAAGLHEKLPDVELHSMIGISLSLGFIFMLLVDHIFGGGHSHGGPTDGRQKSMTATIGLLVHAAADGIALGAAASTARTDVEMIVFFAIMLHKAPAAFGLTSFLLHESYERSRIRRHLLAFSLAAPVCALLTFYGLSKTGKETLTSINGTGHAMLFSAGTFLYVATVHILPELINRETSSDNGILTTHEHKNRLTKKELLFLVLGIILPLFLGLYHKH